MAPVYRLALVGDPVEHSLSPVMHRAAFASSGLDGEYRAIQADVVQLDTMVDDLRRGRISGLNVTMPLKMAAPERCDRLTAEAGAAGSVNTLRSDKSDIEGHSTDVVAFAGLFARFDGIEEVHILGSGGAARAALAAWPHHLAHLSARHPEALAHLTEPSLRVVPWGEGIPGALVVNTTPLGMSGERLPDGALENASGLVDLPYGRTTTPAVANALERSVPFVDGVEFLALQAAASFEWWTGVAVDSGVLVRAARNV